MYCVHYKFPSKLNSGMVTFDGLHITVSELKRKIMTQEGLNFKYSDLQITNEQSLEVYEDDEDIIPKYSCVIVRRIPPTKVNHGDRAFSRDRSVVGSSGLTDSSLPMSLTQLIKTANLVDAKASEEDKIRTMMLQSNHEYDPIHYSKKAIGPPPAHYTCYRCGKAGHYIQQCPLLMVRDNSVVRPKPIRIIKGIPQSFMVKAEPGTKGAMLTSTGEYVIPAIDAEAYAQGKKERPPFVPHDQSSSEDNSDPIPDELLCPVCNDLMTDAVIIPCCGSSYCDDCIRTALLDSEEHVCFTCKQSDVSPDDLIVHKFLRQAVNDYKNGTGYTKRISKQVRHAARPPPRPQLSRPLHSGQQDPLRANGTHLSPASEPTAAPQSQVQPPAPAPTPSSAPTHSATVEGPHVSPAPAAVLGTVDHPPANLHTTPFPGPAPQFSGPPPSFPGPAPQFSGPPPSFSGPGPQFTRPPPSFSGPGPQFSGPPPSFPGPAPQFSGPPPQSLFPFPPQLFPPPYTAGLLPPPPVGYPPQAVYAPGPPWFNSAWNPPNAQPPLAHLGPSLLASHSRSQASHNRSLCRLSPHTRSRSRSRSSTDPRRSRSPSCGRSVSRPRCSRHNRRSYGRSPSRINGYRHSGSHQSRSPGGFWRRSPSGQKPPPREDKPKGRSPERHGHWQRERTLQLEKDYKEWCKKHYGNQHPSLHHRGRDIRDRVRDRKSLLSRDNFPQGRGRRRGEERGALLCHHPSSSSSGTESSETSRKIKNKEHKKKAQRGTITPVRRER